MSVDYTTALHGTVKAVDIVTSDTVALAGGATRAIFVGVGGNLKVTLVGGGTVTYKNLEDGVRIVLHATVVFATGTTCTDLIAEY